MGVGRIDTPQARQIVQTVAAQLIIGYAPPHMVAADDRRRAAQLRRIFGDDTHPEPSIIIGASDDRGMMLGGAVVEPFVSDELISKESPTPRGSSQQHTESSPPSSCCLRPAGPVSAESCFQRPRTGLFLMVAATSTGSWTTGIIARTSTAGPARPLSVTTRDSPHGVPPTAS